MGSFNFSAQTNGVTYIFNPVTDRLVFDDVRISAAGVYFDYLSSPTSTAYLTSFIENKKIGLASAPGTITSSNVVFADGSVLKVGDNTTGTANDNGNNNLAGGTGNDQLIGLGGNDTLSGGAGNDILDGGEGNDSLVGGDGVEFFFDSSGANVFSGGAGDDYFFALTLDGSGLATGGTGRDSYYVFASYGSILAPTNYTVQDFATGATGDLVNISGALYGSALMGLYQGENPLTAGFVRVLQSGQDALVQHDLDGTGSAFGFGTVLTLKNVTATAAASAITGYVLGSLGSDVLTGNDSNQILFSAAGNDTLNGGKGGDNMFGGSGRDTYLVDDRADTIHESSNSSALSGALIINPDGGTGLAGLDDITDTVLAAVTYSIETANFVENLKLTGAVAKEATGNALNNLINGNGLGNLLEGLGGNDTLVGGLGDDTLDGGDGDDFLVLDEGIENWSDSSGNDTLVANLSWTLDADDFMENVALTGSAVRATGNDFANVLTGNSLSNTLTGSGGNDTLRGGAGNDNLNGGVGNDVLNGDGGNDTMVWQAGDTFDGSGGTDVLRLAAGSLNLLTVANSAIMNTETINMAGGGSNRLTLDLSDVLDISSTTNILKVMGNAGDKVDIVPAFTAGAVSGDFRTYTISGGGRLLVDTDVTVI